MSYRIAAMDIHKKVLMVVVVTAAEEVGDATGEALELSAGVSAPAAASAANWWLGCNNGAWWKW